MKSILLIKLVYATFYSEESKTPAYFPPHLSFMSCLYLKVAIYFNIACFGCQTAFPTEHDMCKVYSSPIYGISFWIPKYNFWRMSWAFVDWNKTNPSLWLFETICISFLSKEVGNVDHTIHCPAQSPQETQRVHERVKSFFLLRCLWNRSERYCQTLKSAHFFGITSILLQTTWKNLLLFK